MIGKKGERTRQDIRELVIQYSRELIIHHAYKDTYISIRDFPFVYTISRSVDTTSDGYARHNTDLLFCFERKSISNDTRRPCGILPYSDNKV